MSAQQKLCGHFLHIRNLLSAEAVAIKYVLWYHYNVNFCLED